MFSLHSLGVRCPIFICEWNRVAPTPPLSHDLLPTSPLEAAGGEAGFRWHASAELSTALLATAWPALSLLQPARTGCHGSQVSSYTPTPTPSPPHTLYGLTPSEGSTQAATLSPSVALLCLTFPMLLCHSLSHLTSFCLFVPEQNMGNPNSRRIDRSDVVLFFFFFFFSFF